MASKYRSASRLGKIFVWLSACILIVTLAVYITSVRSALAMDPRSYNCTSDSMMKQLCQDPYGASIGWTVIFVGILGSPLLIAWIIIGIELAARRNHAATPPTSNLS